VKTWRADAALLGNTLIWGATFVLVKDALRDVSPMVYLALRFTLAGLALFLIYGKKLRRDSVAAGVIAGLALFLGYLFQTTGLQYTTPSKSAFYTSLSIPMVPLLAAVLYRKAPRGIEIAGVAVASAGMLLLTTEGSRLVWDRGSLLSFLCAVAFAAHIVTVGYFAKRSSFETVAAVQVITAAVLAGAAFPFFEKARLHWTGPVIGAVAVTALFATALAFSVQAWAQQHTTATRTALIYTLEPVWAWITSWKLTGERLSGTSLTGGLLILAGVLLVELKRETTPAHPTVRAISPEV
jgi:drug/metabolite transporter (DMT)-like permease